jgi:hypothetical protein
MTNLTAPQLAAALTGLRDGFRDWQAAHTSLRCATLRLPLGHSTQARTYIEKVWAADGLRLVVAEIGVRGADWQSVHRYWSDESRFCEVLAAASRLCVRAPRLLELAGLAGIKPSHPWGDIVLAVAASDPLMAEPARAVDFSDEQRALLIRRDCIFDSVRACEWFLAKLKEPPRNQQGGRGRGRKPAVSDRLEKEHYKQWRKGRESKQFRTYEDCDDFRGVERGTTRSLVRKFEKRERRKSEPRNKKS